MKLFLNFILEKNKHYLLHRNYLISSSYYLMYSKKRLDFGKKMSESYDGSFQCGKMSLITFDFLLKNGFENIKVFNSTIGYGKYIEDHVYLKIGNIYIDPTYKQFMRDDRIINNSIISTINNNYQKFVYEELPYFFIGEFDELYNIYKKSLYLNDKVYLSSTRVLDDDIICFWKNSIDVTDYFIKNLYRVNNFRNNFHEDKLLH